MISNPPAFGARIVDTILNTPELNQLWFACRFHKLIFRVDNLKTMSGRIIEMRKRLYEALVKKGTPGTWNHIVDQIGMFSYTGLSQAQCKCLIDKFHIYLVSNGRISMAGINSKNVDYVADAIHYAVTNFSADNKL
jgi:aspartate aminotransferase, cytoplasmic